MAFPLLDMGKCGAIFLPSDNICEKGKSHDVIRIPEKDVKSNVKIDSVLIKINDKFLYISIQAKG